MLVRQASVFRCQASGVSQAAGKQAAGQIGKETFEKANIEYRIMNVESSSGGQVSKECILPVVSFLSNGLFYKKTERSDSTLRHSIFDILRFCGL